VREFPIHSLALFLFLLFFFLIELTISSSEKKKESTWKHGSSTRNKPGEEEGFALPSGLKFVVLLQANMERREQEQPALFQAVASLQSPGKTPVVICGCLEARDTIPLLCLVRKRKEQKKGKIERK
jgi:hypothetical protein